MTDISHRFLKFYIGGEPTVSRPAANSRLSLRLQFIQHQQALGGGACNTEGEQRQTNGGSARVHRQRQTVETAAGGLSGRSREATQTGTALCPQTGTKRVPLSVRTPEHENKDPQLRLFWIQMFFCFPR